MTDTQLSIVIIASLIPSVILHEISHGAAAYAFGDDTAKRAGRLTLNPLRHLDPFGSVILPALLAFSSLGAFGYAKPVPVNPARMRSPRNHSLIVSLAGPATNIVLAVLAAGVWRFTEGDVATVALYAGYVNVILAAFNMIPLPPLDGSAVIERMLPRAAWPMWLKLRRYSLGIVLLVVFFVPQVTTTVFTWALDVFVAFLDLIDPSAS